MFFIFVALMLSYNASQSKFTNLKISGESSWLLPLDETLTRESVAAIFKMEHYKNLSLESIEGEIWKLIKTDTRYLVSNFGRIKSITGRKCNEVILKQDNTGRYLLINIRINKKNSNKTPRHPHRIVALTFIPNPNNYPCVNHINSNRFDNRVDNLEWTTHIKNVRHSIDFGNRDNYGENNYCSKLKNEDVIFIRENHHKSYSVKQLSEKYGVSLSLVYQIIEGHTWKRPLKK